MKFRFYFILTFLLFAAIYLPSCVKPQTSSFVFTDDNYVTNYIDIYLHQKEYDHAEIIIEGVFKKSITDDKTYYYLVRYGVNVCEIHEYEFMGFELEFSDDVRLEEGDWICVNGVLEVYCEEGQEFLKICVSEYTHVPEGSLFVYT